MEGDMPQSIFDIHTVAIFKVFNRWSLSFLIPWRCRWSHNLILSDMKVDILMREELWKHGTYLVIGVIPVESKGFKDVKILSLANWELGFVGSKTRVLGIDRKSVV